MKFGLFDRLSALKIALFLVLAANLSWNSFNGLNKTELAAEEKSAVPSRTKGGGGEPRPLDPQVRRPLDRTDRNYDVKYTELICGARYRMTVHETKSRDNEEIILIELRDVEHLDRKTSFTRLGTWSQWRDNKSQLYEKAETTIIDRFGSCKNSKAELKNDDEWARRRAFRETEARRGELEKDRAARDRRAQMRACDKNYDGDKLSRYARRACLIDRINNLEAEIDDDSGGRKSRDLVARAVKDIIREVRPDIKEDLRSRNEEKNEAAMDDLNDLIANLESVDVARGEIAPIIAELKAMRLAGKFGLDSARIHENAREKSQDLTDSYNRVKLGDRSAVGSYQKALADLQALVHSATQTLSAPAQDLLYLRNANILNKSDVDLLMPFAQLSDLPIIRNSTLWGLPPSSAFGINSMGSLYDPRISSYDPLNPMGNMLSAEASRLRMQAYTQSRSGVISNMGPGYQINRPVTQDGFMSNNPGLWNAPNAPARPSGSIPMKPTW